MQTHAIVAYVHVAGGQNLKDQIRVGLIGCGSHTTHVLAPALFDANACIVAACDVVPAALARFTSRYTVESTFTDYRSLLSEAKVDAVVVATAPDSHARIAMEAMESGVNVFVEKAPALTALEAERVVECQEKTDRFTMVGFNRRYATAYRMAANIARENAPVRLMQSRYHAQDYGNEERFLIGHLVHHVDLARFYLGEIDDVHCFRVKASDGKLGYSINLKAMSGAIANIQSASMLNFNYPQEYFQIMGDGWEVVVENHQDLRYNRDDRPAANRSLIEGMELDETRDSIVWSQNRTMFPPMVYHDQGFRAEVALFVESCRTGTLPETGIADAAKTLRLLERIGSAE